MSDQLQSGGLRTVRGAKLFEALAGISRSVHRVDSRGLAPGDCLDILEQSFYVWIGSP